MIDYTPLANFILSWVQITGDPGHASRNLCLLACLPCHPSWKTGDSHRPYRRGGVPCRGHRTSTYRHLALALDLDLLGDRDPPHDSPLDPCAPNDPGRRFYRDDRYHTLRGEFPCHP
jgi:hypothetical protein